MRGFILAAGRGSRLRPLTDTTPKPLVAVRGQPLIDWRLQAMAAAGIEEVVINTAWLGDQIHHHVRDGARYGLRVRYSDEGATALETGGGFARALEMLGRDAPVLVTNADVWTDYPLDRLVARRWSDAQLAHLVLVPTPNGGRADFALDGEQVRNSAPCWTFSGISIWHPRLVADEPVRPFSIVPALRSAADIGQVTGEIHQGVWSDIGTPERLAAANAQI